MLASRFLIHIILREHAKIELCAINYKHKLDLSARTRLSENTGLSLNAKFSFSEKLHNYGA